MYNAMPQPHPRAGISSGDERASRRRGGDRFCSSLPSHTLIPTPPCFTQGGEALAKGAKALEEYDSEASIAMYTEALDLYEEVWGGDHTSRSIDSLATPECPLQHPNRTGRRTWEWMFTGPWSPH